MDTAMEIAKSAVAPIQKQFGYLFEYSSNIKDFEEQVGNLKNEIDVIQSRVTAAERNGERIFPHVIQWLDNAKTFLEEAVKFLNEEINANTHFLNLWSRHQLSRKAKKKIPDVEQLMKTGKMFNEISEYVPPPLIELASSETWLAFGSRKETSAKIVDGLKDDNVQMIGIYGLPGVGKTTFVKHIAELLQSERLFDDILILTVSQTPDFLKTQDRIAEIIGAKMIDTKTTEGRASHLHGILNKMLKDGKKILVVIDDIWERLNLKEKIGIPVGCKIVLTSRDKGVCQQMGSYHNYMLEGLHEDESWSLFENIVGHNAIELLQRRRIAAEIIKACGGLPLALNVTASALKYNDNLFCWEDAIAKLKRNDLAQTVTESLRLSYEFLKKEPAAQELLLLCSLLPEDFEIHTDHLLRWGLGLGLFQDVASLDTSIVRVHARVEYLKSSSLLLDVEGKSCVKMHDVVREFTLKVAREQHTKFAGTEAEFINWKRHDIARRCTAISLYGTSMDVFNDELEYPALELLIFRGSKLWNLPSGMPSNMFAMMKMLRILSIWNMLLISLPPSFVDLQNLRTLDLVFCQLEDLSIIGELKALQILNLSSSSVSELPREIGKLSNLLVLDLSGCCDLKLVPSGIIQGMSHLEGLHMVEYNNWELDGAYNQRENANLEDLRFLSQLVTLEVHIPNIKLWPKDIVFRNLRRFKISVGSPFDYNDLYTCSSKIIQLKPLTSTWLGDGLDGFFQIAEEIIMENIKGFQNGLYHDFDGDHLHNLKSLAIRKFGEMKYVVDATEMVPYIAFPLLEILDIRDLDNLLKICRGRPPEGSFGELKKLKVHGLPKLRIIWNSPIKYALLPNLRVLEVYRCHKLEVISTFMIGDLSQLIEMQVCDCEAIEEIFCNYSKEDREIMEIVLPRLQKLELRDLPKLKTFISIERSLPAMADVGTHIQEAFFNGKVRLPALETLELAKLDNIKALWCRKLPVESFAPPKHLTVRQCSQLREVILPHLLQPIQNNIQTMTLYDCTSVENLFHLEAPTVGERNAPLTFHCLKTLLVGRLPKVEYLFDRKVSFPALEELKVHEMDGLREIWQIPQPVGSFHRLRKLTVWGCHNLLNIVPSNLCIQLLSLKELKVSSCKSLEGIFGDAGGEVEHANVAMPHVSSIELLWIPMLKSFCHYKWDFEWPSLRVVRLISCCKMETFTYGVLKTPMLKKIQVDSRMKWNGDLNSTVRGSRDSCSNSWFKSIQVLLSGNNNNHEHNIGGERNDNTANDDDNDNDGGADDDCDDGSNYDCRNGHHHDKKRRRIS